MLIDASHPLVLGSGSPRRREIISALGLPFRVLAADINEDVLPGEAPLAYLERIAAEKLAGVRERLAGTAHAAILVADTSVVIDGDVLGKPTDVDDAARLFSRIAGRVHSVYTRYAIGLAGEPGVKVARTVETHVHIRAAEPSEIRAYAATGEGLDKAGAYAAQGIGSFFIERVVGSYSNVVGLPACEVLADLRALGLASELAFSPVQARV
ncbi:MAG TPA: nucleoside triphosphate pyrophosphatase [Polyangiaceae bacterium]|nr:nucleoside triphosphate pyrophosphatase [Polyangiaceae bacterium]